MVALLGAAIIGAPAIRYSILRAAGSALVANDPFGSADIIVASVDADAAGVLQASDLVHSGVATRVAVFALTPDVVENEFAHRKIPRK